MRPLVILVHGSLSCAEEWADYHGLLPDIDLMTLDLPGHGSRVAEPFTTDGAVALISEAVAQRSPNQPVVLVGHSLGGYMASVYAARYRDTLTGMVLIGASGDPRSPMASIYRGYAWLVDRVNHHKLAAIRNAVARILGLTSQQLPGADAYACLPAAWQAVIDDCPPELMASATCPVLFVNGQFDQMRLNERRYLTLTKDGELTIIPRATHLAPLTHPRQVAAVIQQFTDRIATG